MTKSSSKFKKIVAGSTSLILGVQALGIQQALAEGGSIGERSEVIQDQGIQDAKNIEAINQQILDLQENIDLNQFSDPESEIGKIAQGSLGGEAQLDQKLKQELMKQDGADKKQSRWEREIGKLKIEIPISADTDIGKYINGEVEFKRRVEPAFVAGEQLQTDSYLFEIGTTKALRAGIRLKISFAKLFRGEGAKKNALFSKPKWINKVPNTAKDILANLEVGEMVRIEVDGVLGLKPTDSNSTKKTKEEIGVGYTHGATFLMDIAKVSKSEAKLRFVGLKNRGTFSLDLSARKSIVGGRLFGGKFGEAMSLGFGFGAEKSATFLHDHPIDSMMVSYKFNLKSEEARNAIDQIFQNVKKVGFLKLFQPSAKEDTLAQDLLKNAELAEKLALADAYVAGDGYRVKHDFRGRMTSANYKINAQGNMSVLAKFKVKSGGATTFVKKYKNGTNELEYYFLDNQNSEVYESLGAGLYSKKEEHDLDILVKSDEKKSAGKFMNLISRIEVQRSSMNSEDLKNLRNRIQLVVPPSLSQDPRLDAYLPKDKQTNASYILQSTLGTKALEFLQNMYENLTTQNLINYFERHPEAKNMGLMSLSAVNGEASGSRFLWEDAQQFSKGILDVVQANSDKDRADAFSRHSQNSTFGRWILGDFLQSQIPPEQARKGMEYIVKFGSDQFQGNQSLVLGEEKSAEVYPAIKFMRKVIDDRRFESILDGFQERQ